MSSFGRYAELYDSFYGDKDYAAETRYVLQQLHRCHPHPRTVLELGAGTGSYSRQLAASGLEVTGLELSPGMLARARQCGEQGVHYQQGDLRTARLDRTFDVVLALFHVASYQVEDADLLAMFATARAHLRPGGIFAFDAWYGQGVEADPPARRFKTAEVAGRTVQRTATPVHHPNLHRVDVRFDFEITNGAPLDGFPFGEVHSMRYLYLDEVRDFSARTGFRVVDASAWMTGAEPSRESWYVLFVLECAAGSSVPDPLVASPARS